MVAIDEVVESLSGVYGSSFGFIRNGEFVKAQTHISSALHSVDRLLTKEGYSGNLKFAEIINGDEDALDLLAIGAEQQAISTILGTDEHFKVGGLTASLLARQMYGLRLSSSAGNEEPIELASKLYGALELTPEPSLGGARMEAQRGLLEVAKAEHQEDPDLYTPAFEFYRLGINELTNAIKQKGEIFGDEWLAEANREMAWLVGYGADTAREQAKLYAANGRTEEALAAFELSGEYNAQALEMAVAAEDNPGITQQSRSAAEVLYQRAMLTEDDKGASLLIWESFDVHIRKAREAYTANPTAGVGEGVFLSLVEAEVTSYSEERFNNGGLDAAEQAFGHVLSNIGDIPTQWWAHARPERLNLVAERILSAGGTDYMEQVNTLYAPGGPGHHVAGE